MVVKQGDKVKIDYEGRLESGEIFDTSKHGDHSHPLEFTVGEKAVIPGFEKEVIGMKEGEDKEFTIKKEEGYGEYREDLKQEIPRDKLPPEQEPKEGMMLMMGTPDGKQFPVKISKVEKEKVVLDMNHPLAGKDLIFKIKVLEIANGK